MPRTASSQARVCRSSGLLRRAEAVVDEYGVDSVSAQFDGAELSWWSAGADAGVPYHDTGRAWVAAGSPAGPAADVGALAAEFVQAARERGRRALFFGVEGPSRPELVEESRLERLRRDAGLRAVEVGSEMFWDPSTWSQTKRSKRSLREQLRRARAKGVEVTRWDPTVASASTIHELDTLLDRWRQSRHMPPMSFVAHTDALARLDRRHLYIARQGSRICGVLVVAVLPAANRWFFEHLVRIPGAPNGTSELLFDHGMQEAREANVGTVTLGMVPLIGLSARWARISRAMGRRLYDFDGLHAFKRKLVPGRQVPIYVLAPAKRLALGVIWDVLTAFAGTSLTRFGLRTIGHRLSPLRRLGASLGRHRTRPLVAEG